MTTYYRVSDGRRDIELSVAQYAERVVNGKAGDLRIYIVDPQPVPSATQVVINNGMAIGPIEAHQTYALRNKTVNELEVDVIETERVQITQYIADIQTQLDISNATRGAMTTNQRLNTLEADTRTTMRAVKLLLRQARRSS